MTEIELQKACRLGDCAKIKEILSESPLLLNELDESLGWPPLYRTVTCGHIEASKLLLSMGANPNLKNKLGDSSLHQAVESDQISLVQLLLDNNAETNIQQNDGDTPLHYSSLKDLPDIVNLLLKYRANPNIQENVFGKTALHIAVENKNIQIIQMLLKHYARTDLKDFTGRTPLDLCEETKQFILSFLEKEDNFSKKTPSFDHSIASAKIDSIIEPESEQRNQSVLDSFSSFSFGSDTHKNSLYKWLTSMKLESLFNPLYSNGYDDLVFLISQTKSSEPLTPSILEEIGIPKCGHRLKLLALLEEEAFKDMRSSVPVQDNFFCSQSSVPLPSLQDWLETIGLKKLYINFFENGVEDMDTFAAIMQSKYAFNDESLKNGLKIEMLGHRQRILSKIKEDIGPGIRHKRALSKMQLENDEPMMACEFCLVC